MITTTAAIIITTIIIIKNKEKILTRIHIAGLVYLFLSPLRDLWLPAGTITLKSSNSFRSNFALMLLL